MTQEFRSGNPKEPLKFSGREAKIKAVPAGYNYVRIDGYSIQGGGRTFGLKLMKLAEGMGGFSPGNIDTPEEKMFSMSLSETGIPETDQKLLEFLNARLAEGCAVEFSDKK